MSRYSIRIFCFSLLIFKKKLSKSIQIYSGSQGEKDFVNRRNTTSLVDSFLWNSIPRKDVLPILLLTDLSDAFLAKVRKTRNQTIWRWMQ